MKDNTLALKAIQCFLRAIELSCSVTILGIFTYYLIILHDHDLYIATYIRTVEGISGLSILYTTSALLSVCCLGGVAFLSITILLDLAFIGAFIYIVWETRGGASTCNGNVNTSGDVSNGNNGFTHLPSLHEACKLETVVFSITIVALIFYSISICVQVALTQVHKNEKAFGPSPRNGYTSGLAPKRYFWQHRRKEDIEAASGPGPDTLPYHTTLGDVRTSHATDTTAVNSEQGRMHGGDKLSQSAYVGTKNPM